MLSHSQNILCVNEHNCCSESHTVLYVRSQYSMGLHINTSGLSVWDAEAKLAVIFSALRQLGTRLKSVFSDADTA